MELIIIVLIVVALMGWFTPSQVDDTEADDFFLDGWDD